MSATSGTEECSASVTNHCGMAVHRTPYMDLNYTLLRAELQAFEVTHDYHDYCIVRIISP